jgi:hypothetical protein
VKRTEAYALINYERERQGRQWAGEHEWGFGDCSSDGVPQIVKASVLERRGVTLLDKDPTNHDQLCRWPRLRSRWKDEA